MEETRLTTEDKALKINLKPDIYGCFVNWVKNRLAAKFFQQELNSC